MSGHRSAIARFAVPLVFASSACSPANVAGPLDAGTDSTSEAGSADAVAESGADEACQNFAYGFCQRLSTCSSVALEERFGTEPTCDTIEQSMCEAVVRAPSSGETPTTLAACTAALGDWACTDVIHTQNRPPACQNETMGSLPNGAGCGTAQQCQSGYCAYLAGQACGTCAPIPQPGDSCTVNQCPAGLACESGICQAYAQTGAACSSSQPCDEGLACAPSSTPGSSVCESGATAMGAPCSFAGAGCDFFGGLACNAQSGMCETLQLAQPGQACGIVANQNTACAQGVCERGQCVAFISPGGACEVGGQATCVSILRCIASSDGGTEGTCQYNGSTACP